MNWRERLADWISFGALTRAREWSEYEAEAARRAERRCDSWREFAANQAESINALQAERDAALAGAVTVKPLEWADNADTNLGCDWVDTFGLYEITEDAVLFSGKCSTGQRYSTIKAAKADAQADYEARIRAVLIPAPDTLRQVREALLMARTFIEGREQHIGIVLNTGDAVRAALALLTKDG